MSDNEIIVPELNNETVESMIYIVHGEKAMLDFELAKIYGYTTKAFNQQEKNNSDKFPPRYRFQFTNVDIELISRPKNFTAMPILQTEGIEGGRSSLPWAFTE